MSTIAPERHKEEVIRHDDDFSFEAVPSKNRRSFWAVGFVMLGFTFFSASMSVGAKLGNGLNYTQYVWAVIVGGAILAVYTGALGYIGAKTGLSFDLMSRRTFGRIGSFLPSALISFTQMGWFGVGVAMFAIPTAETLHINAWPVVIIAGGLMTASAYFGIKAIEIVSFVSVPLIAFFIGNTLMFTFGAVGGAFTGKDDIFYVMIAQGLLIPALIVLGANIWTTNNNALYTTGLGYANITGINKKPLVLVAGIIGTLGALWLYDNFVGWLSLLNATLPPIGAVLVADYFARRRSYMDLGSNDPEVKWAPIVALIAGALTGWLTPGFGIVSINAMVVAILVYFVGSAIEKGIRR